jgi:hypothetical protein
MALFNVSHGGGAPTSAVVGTSNVVIRAEEQLRRYLYIKSPSTNTGLIYLSLGATAATVGDGILLEPGDTYIIDDHNLYIGAVQAISTAAAQALLIHPGF